MLVRNKQKTISITPPTNKSSRTAFLIGAFLILGSCLAGVQFWTSYDKTVPTVVAANSIDRGQRIELEDLKVVQTNGDFERIGSLDTAIGRIASDSFVEGEILTSSDLGTEVQVGNNKTVIGVLLGPGGYPTPNIEPGSRVDVFTSGDAETNARLIAPNVEIFDVTRSENNNEILFALVLSESQATQVARAEKNDIRIALKGS